MTGFLVITVHRLLLLVEILVNKYYLIALLYGPLHPNIVGRSYTSFHTQGSKPLPFYIPF